jgi:hypothetical protein
MNLAPVYLPCELHVACSSDETSIIAKRTMGFDVKTHNIFLPAADFDAPAAGERRGKIKPGSFVVLVVGRQ